MLGVVVEREEVAVILCDLRVREVLESDRVVDGTAEEIVLVDLGCEFVSFLAEFLDGGSCLLYTSDAADD